MWLYEFQEYVEKHGMYKKICYSTPSQHDGLESVSRSDYLEFTDIVFHNGMVSFVNGGTRMTLCQILNVNVSKYLYGMKETISFKCREPYRKDKPVKEYILTAWNWDEKERGG